MIRIVYSLLVAIIYCSLFIAHAGDSIAVAAERFEELADENRRMAIGELRETLDKAFSDNVRAYFYQLPSLTDDEVRSFMHAASVAAFYTKRREYVEIQSGAFEILEQRSAVTESDVRTLHRSYVLIRQFDMTSGLAKAHSSVILESIPEIAKSDSYTAANAYIISPDGELTATDVKLDYGDLLVALVHPNCGFSRRAMKDIIASKDSVSVEKIIWVLPFDAVLAADTIQEWQSAHPTVVFTIPINFDEWAFLQRQEVPTFYRLRDGEMKGEVVGWPAGGNLDELRRLFEIN